MDRLDELVFAIRLALLRDAMFCRAHGCEMPANDNGYCADHAHLVEPSVSDEDTRPMTFDTIALERIDTDDRTR